MSKKIKECKNCVWVIEMKSSGLGWFPVEGQERDLDQAEYEKEKWEKQNPNMKFRITKYLSTRAK